MANAPGRRSTRRRRVDRKTWTDQTGEAEDGEGKSRAERGPTSNREQRADDKERDERLRRPTWSTHRHEPWSDKENAEHGCEG